MSDTAASSINADAVVQLPTGVRMKRDQVRERDVLLAPERALVLDPIGVAILGQVDGTKSVGQIVEALAGIYAADPQVISKDVIAFLSDLAERRMLEVMA
jgi:pyrroloquinoline quinone biosynthesis protein D